MENHIDPSTMLEFIEGLAAMAVLDQDGVYTYVSPGWERYTGHTAQEAIGRKVWEMVPDTHATEVFHTGKPVFAKAVNANGPAFTSYFPRFDRDGKLCGLFLYVIVQGMEDAQNLTRRIGELSSKVEFYQQELSRERGARYGLDNIIGESASVLRLKEQIVQAARSTSTVLIEGETGQRQGAHRPLYPRHERPQGGQLCAGQLLRDSGRADGVRVLRLRRPAPSPARPGRAASAAFSSPAAAPFFSTRSTCSPPPCSPSFSGYFRRWRSTRWAGRRAFPSTCG